MVGDKLRQSAAIKQPPSLEGVRVNFCVEIKLALQRTCAPGGGARSIRGQ